MAKDVNILLGTDSPVVQGYPRPLIPIFVLKKFYKVFNEFIVFVYVTKLASTCRVTFGDMVISSNDCIVTS